MEIKLENCSKNELIYFIRKRCMVNLRYLGDDVSEYQADVALEKAGKETDKVIEALREYDNLLAPYAGKCYADIPAEVFQRAGDILKKRDRHLAAFKRYTKQFNSLTRQK